MPSVKVTFPSPSRLYFVIILVAISLLSWHAISHGDTLLAEYHYTFLEPVFAQNSSLDLLDANKFTWRPLNYANVSMADGNLYVTVHTNNTDTIYNRASMQAQLHLEGDVQQGGLLQEAPLELTLDYIAKSLEGKALFAVDVFDLGDPEYHRSVILRPATQEGQNLTSARLVLDDVIDKPIEFRFYIATSEPGSHTLVVENATLSSNATGISASS